ncbi:MAG TPA: galactokinase family protein, partial [Thermomicrobiales bacterium]|nr:galactokinase family protein [Thermomicrobiales bacterium]
MSFWGEEELKTQAIATARTAFGESWTPSRWAIGPGRLELLGNHVDYNGGLVLAGAIDRAVMIGISETGSPDKVEFITPDISSGRWEIDLDTIGDWHAAPGESGTEAYARGVAASLLGRGIAICDELQLSIVGNVPLGFGMSSSAGLCVSLVLALAADTPSDRDIVLIAQDGEHRAGAPVGAMDQSASVAGGIIIFDGADISFRRILPDLGDYVFAVADSGVDHSNATSSYPARVQESRAALEILRERLDPDLASLGAITPEQWSEVESSGDRWLDQTLLERTRHVVTEMARVREGIGAVKTADWSRFGQLMNASGRSSAIDYAISHPRV